MMTRGTEGKIDSECFSRFHKSANFMESECKMLFEINNNKKDEHSRNLMKMKTQE